MVNTGKVVLFCFFPFYVLGLVGAAETRRASCHPLENKDKEAPLCEVVTIPKGFCGACPLGPVFLSGPRKDLGKHVDCTKTYEVETDTCLPAFEKYVELNPCDLERAMAVEEFKNTTDAVVREDGRLTLDFFVFTICEFGCDCLPVFDATYKDRVLDVYRSNCQAHAQNDVCRVFPNIRLIQLEGMDYDETTTAIIPKACPPMKEWKNSPDSVNFLTNPKTTVQDDVKVFLERFGNATETVDNLNTWNACAQMEMAQSRMHNATVCRPTLGGAASACPET